MPTQTPPDLPATGRSFTINLPDDEIWFALFLGLLLSLTYEFYWEQSPGGLTPAETCEAYSEAFKDLRYDLGTPDE